MIKQLVLAQQTAKVIELKDRKLEIKTVVEGDEPTKFKEIINFEVVERDTPFFLKSIEKKERTLIIDF